MKPEITSGLRPYQVNPAARLLQTLQEHRVGFDLSDTGTGKTYVAAAIAAQLQVPTLAIVPKVAEGAWRRAAEHFQDSISVVGWEMLRTGHSPYGRWENGEPTPKEARVFYKCLNCQRTMQPDFIPPCPAHWKGWHCFDTKYKPFNRGKFLFNLPIGLLIFDEVHRAAGDSLDADMVIAAKRQNIPTLALTATLAHSPLQLQATGYLAGLHQLGDFGRFCSRRGCRRIPQRGMQWLAPVDQQEQIMRDIGAQIIPARGIRITREDVPDFPGRNILPELYDLPRADTEELDALYALLSEPMNDLAVRSLSDKDPQHPLTQRLRARQRIELLKVGIAQELGELYLEEGKSVVWFVNFQQTIDELLRRFPGAGVINGQITGAARENIVAAFQCNQNRALVVNNQAGGISLSLHDLDGAYGRVGIVFPTDSPVVMQQLFGRLARAGGKSDVIYRVIFASRSVEVPMRRALELRYCNLDALRTQNNN